MLPGYPYPFNQPQLQRLYTQFIINQDIVEDLVIQYPLYPRLKIRMIGQMDVINLVIACFHSYSTSYSGRPFISFVTSKIKLLKLELKIIQKSNTQIMSKEHSINQSLFKLMSQFQPDCQYLFNS
ncbi:unnamed protein product [Paramecium octaurelia]|uniref:Uncharacterized protein n=1 Tax=Paramecium octaurelia TaxID=43137 RepID=A0A8S1TW68_PAROT|nr:unnamed protein product [Paramecium octaurelia]